MRNRTVWTQNLLQRCCPLCGKATHRIASNRMQHRLNLTTVVCEACSFVFTNPVPSREVYERFYLEDYSRFYGHITPKPLRIGIEPENIKDKLDSLESFTPLARSRLLEIGPGNGLFLYWAKHRGANVFGVEPSPEFCRVLAAAGLPHLRATLSDLKAETHGQFDIIYMAHVLEHFYDPNEALQRCSLLLKSDGILALEVPNILKPFRSLDNYFLRYVHLSNFSPHTLRAMLQKHAFEPLHVDEGGKGWRTPQNLAVIARQVPRANSHQVALRGEVENVCRTLSTYRRNWNLLFAPRWHARALLLGARRTLLSVGRPVKRVFMGKRPIAGSPRL